ncbi:MAG: SDR family oxidoreductase [Actinomycetota bacterium]|nr:SDR family oxidoreductase [Actinomycetota bacterium]
MVAAAVDGWGGLDIAVNNAGIEIGKPLIEHGDEEFSRLMDINVKGVFLGIKHEAPAMIAGGGGAIVNMSSVEEVAEMVAFLASDDARFVTASHYVLDGGLTGSLF